MVSAASRSPWPSYAVTPSVGAGVGLGRGVGDDCGVAVAAADDAARAVAPDPGASVAAAVARLATTVLLGSVIALTQKPALRMMRPIPMPSVALPNVSPRSRTSSPRRTYAAAARTRCDRAGVTGVRNASQIAPVRPYAI